MLDFRYPYGDWLSSLYLILMITQEFSLLRLPIPTLHAQIVAQLVQIVQIVQTVQIAQNVAQIVAQLVQIVQTVQTLQIAQNVAQIAAQIGSARCKALLPVPDVYAPLSNRRRVLKSRTLAQNPHAAGAVTSVKSPPLAPDAAGLVHNRGRDADSVEENYFFFLFNFFFFSPLSNRPVRILEESEDSKMAAEVRC